MKLLTRGRCRLLTPQILKVVKLIIILLTAGALQISARGISQTVTFSGKDVSLKKLFAAIENQTGYVFFYDASLLREAKPITLKVKDAVLEEVLERSFKDQPLSWSMVNKTITIIRKQTVELQSTGMSAEQNLPIDIKGRLVNENNEPVVGASIRVKGTSIGTTTNDNGEFSLSGIAENATLVFSGTNIETFETRLQGKTDLNLTAKIKENVMGEVIINKGYYTEKQKFSVSNVGRVTAAEIEKQPVNNPLLAMQGRIPGLLITQSTGLPGTGVKVRIQGQNSIAAGNDPLYVIDGVPYTSQLLPNIAGVLGGSGGQVINGTAPSSGNPLSYLNPSDIESIEVLKDADATAIYGSRAANGAVLITTKKGKSGETKVVLNFQNGFGKVPRFLDLMNTSQYLEMRREAKLNDNAAISAFDYDINGVWDSTRNTDWQKELIGGTAKYLDAQLSVSGGNNLTQFLIGGNFHRETTVFPGSFNDKKASVHFNISNSSINQKFKMQFSGSYLFDNNHLSGNDITLRAVTFAPDAPPLYNPDGSLNWAPNSSGNATWTTPLSYLLKLYNNKTQNIVGNSIIRYQIFSGLEFKTSLGYNQLTTDEISTTPLISFAPNLRPNRSRSAAYSNGSTRSWIIEPQITYKRKIYKGDLDVFLGTTFQEILSKVILQSGFGYSSDLVLEDIMAASSVSTESFYSKYRYNAIFGRINYKWKDKYIIALSTRRDGSSRFGSNTRFNNFGSIAGAWIFSNEKFIQDNVSFLSFGKLRFSYGTTGSDQIGDYQFINRYVPVATNTRYQGTNGIAVTGLTNPYLEWESTKKLQFGGDISILNNKIEANVNCYINKSSNQFLSYNLPIITGFTSISRNFPAQVKNSGLEISITAKPITRKNFNWTTGGNITFAKNELIKFDSLATSSYATSLIVGKPLTIAKIFHYAGVDPTTGIYSFSDIHGNATINPNGNIDNTVIVNTTPTFYGGLSNNIQIGSFQIDIFFQFVKQKGAGYSYGNVGSAAFNNNQPVSLLQRWRKTGDISNYQKFSSNSSLRGAYNNLMQSDAVLGDASYLRLKNVSVYWSIPERLLKATPLKSGRLYVQGQNLLTFTKYKGLDPETLSSTTLPALRVITFGVEIAF